MVGFYYFCSVTDHLFMNEDREVRIHNALTTARYEYTEMQSNIFLVLLSKLTKDGLAAVYQLTVPEMEEMTGKKHNYKQLREATKAMMGRVHEMETVHNNREVFRQLVLFKRTDYILGTGIIEMEFNEYASPYLFDLKNNFTSFQLRAALSLTSKHAKRIYQICSQWKDKGETKKTTLLDLKKTLGLATDKEEYPDLAMFKKKVLDVAVKQINEKTDLRIDYQLEKVGRAFKTIVFTVKPKDRTSSGSALQDEVPGLTSLPDEVHGMSTAQVDIARRLLTQLNIITPPLVDKILASRAHILGCNKFSHELKMGMHAKVGSLSGLLLTILGLKKPANGPLFDKPTSKTTRAR